VKESGIVQVLAAERATDANSIQFLVLATPKRYAPSLPVDHGCPVDHVARSA
jgi:hypothetical protein